MKHRRKWLTGACLLVGAALVSGCGPTPPALTPASGVVTLRGKPLPNAHVQFVPLIQGFGGEYIAEGVTDEAGQFQLSCSMGAGACACENLVIVSEGPLPDDARGSSAESQMKASQFMAALANRPIPEKFTTAAQSPLKIIVTLEQNTYDIDLSAAKVGASP